VVAGGVVLRGFPVVLGRVLVVLRCRRVVLGRFLGHGNILRGRYIPEWYPRTSRVPRNQESYPATGDPAAERQALARGGQSPEPSRFAKDGRAISLTLYTAETRSLMGETGFRTNLIGYSLSGSSPSAQAFNVEPEPRTDPTRSLPAGTRRIH